MTTENVKKEDADTMLIEHIDQVLPHIKDKPEFVVIDKGDYKVIDYVYVDKDSFDHPVAIECRGIKFSSDGSILSRPFAKFFNVGEKQQLNEIDLNLSHHLLHKLDGSMIHPAVINDQLVFMTRKVLRVLPRPLLSALLAIPNTQRLCGG